MTKNCLEIEDVSNFESLETWRDKKAAFGWLGKPFKKNHQNSIPRKVNVHLFGDMTKTSIERK